MQKIKNMFTPRKKGLVVFVVGIAIILLGVVLPTVIPTGDYDLYYSYETSMSYGDKTYEVIIFDKEERFEDGVREIEVRINYTNPGGNNIRTRKVRDFDFFEQDDGIVIRFRLVIDSVDAIYYKEIRGVTVFGRDPDADVGNMPEENEKDNRRLSIIIPASILGGLMTISGIITMIVASNTVNTLIETGTDDISQIAENFKQANEQSNGVSKKIVCEYCGSINKPGATKCENCGARLKQ